MTDARDSVTVGEIRLILEERFNEHLSTLDKLLRLNDAPGAKVAKAEAYLKGPVSDSLNELDKLNTWAGLPKLIRTLRTG